MGDRRLVPPDVWARLESESSALGSGHLRHRVAVDAPVDVYLAVERPSGARVLALGFDRRPRTSLGETVHLRGLRVSEAPFQLEERPWTVSIATSRAEDNPLFAELADDLVGVVSASSSADQASDDLAARLECWRRFLERAGPGGLPEAAQAGLYGELWTLREVIGPATSIGAAVACWEGPSGAAQDFQGRSFAVEVKASRQLAPTSILISNERQLDAAGRDYLGLVVVGLEQAPGGSESLPEMVASLRLLLASSPMSLLAFEDRLLSAGYMDAHAHLYAEAPLTVRWSRFFRVDDAFPRITERMLPPGVGSVSYEIALDACAPHAIDLAAFQARLRGVAT